MHRLNLLIIVIGAFCGALTYAQDEISEDGGSPHKGMVLVEPTNVLTTSTKGVYLLKPYAERRPRWGTTFGIGYSTYEPVHYEPNFAPTEHFGDVYLTPDVPTLEAQFTVKRNLSFGSLGMELAVGIYRNTSDIDTAIVDSTLTMYPVRLGAVFALDVLASEPFIVPYVAGGLYTVEYREEQGSSSHNGNTQVAPYVNGGLAFSLDWLDRRAARLAYEDSGIQSTYIFAEARKQFPSGDASDPDFENDISFAGGVRVEF
jgi:hypothetical protein